ncbi:MAG: ATP-binding cassette domain-containing protein [Bacillota bacterium]|jgi:molybdate transport system ATP-binding protein|nr:ATP-binding cassette domain-containing protein [Bacillota bacterium]
MSLEVKIKKRYKDFSLDVSLETKGEYLGILGASGSGKSLTLKCIAGVETPDEGKIVLKGRVLFDSENNINIKPQSRNIGYMFQNYALFPNMTAEENIGVGLKLTKKEKKKRVKELLSLFRLEDMGHKYPAQLSGGQQQRVALARIIAYEPDVLLLDEPFSALDSKLKSELHTEFLDMLNLYKGEVIIVTHSKEEVYRISENLALIENGTITGFGKTKEIFEHPKSLSEAKMIGCKNISPCEILSDNRILCKDWGLVLETEGIPINCKYAGIPSENFEIVNEPGINTIECKLVNVIEEINGYLIVFKNNKRNENSILYFNINKETWNKKKSQNPLYLKIKDFYLLI